MKHWNEIKSALEVARHGTVSAAAIALGVHRATIIRHVDELEKVLGQKLFQRHSKGYEPTEAGIDLLQTAKACDDQFDQMLVRTGRNDALTGEFLVTSVTAIAEFILPAIEKFQKIYPLVQVRYLTQERLFKLEYGEAHIAIRAGPKPQEPDNVVSLFHKMNFKLYANKKYITEHGLPSTLAELKTHQFVVHDSASFSPSFNKWLYANIPESQFKFKSTSVEVLQQAIRQGIGIGFMRTDQADILGDIVIKLPFHEDWYSKFWIITHVDMHRSAKVQAFLKILKSDISNSNIIKREG